MPANQLIQTLIERRQQKNPLGAVNPKRCNTSMQSGRKGNRKRRLERIEESGSKHFCRRGGENNHVPMSLGDEFLKPVHDNLFFIGDLKQRVAVELQTDKIESDRLGDHRQKATIMRHGAGPAADEADCSFDYFSHLPTLWSSVLTSQVETWVNRALISLSPSPYQSLAISPSPYRHR